jgi:hypothetical protein
MRELPQVLGDATGSIDWRYFHLAVDGGPPIYRERVYCYELYHQMRSLWPGNCPYCLNGEVDKAGHPILPNLGVRRAIPDLLVHQPGSMRGNYAIIEVKNPLASPAGIMKDLKKLDLFVRNVGYQKAIYLTYGGAADRLVDNIIRCACKIPDLASIELWVHQHVGEPAIHRVTLPGEGTEGMATATPGNQV